MKTHIRAPKKTEVKRITPSPLQDDGFLEPICDGIQGVLVALGCENEDPGYTKIVCDVANGVLSIMGCETVGPEPSPPPECNNDGDCDEYEVCDDGSCVPDPEDCRGGLDCGADHCDEDDGQCYECVIDDHCPTGWSCVDHECKEGVECITDEDCPESYICVDNECMEVDCVDDEDCGDHNICDQETNTCTGDPVDCRSTLPGKLDCENPTPVCDPDDGNCVECLKDEDCPDDPYTQACSSKTCVADSNDCRWDPENSCPEVGETCDDGTGQCVPDPDHCINYGCPEWEHCDAVSGECEVDTGRCNDDGDCGGSTPACHQGTHYCEECYTDDDCDPEEYCSEEWDYTCRPDPDDCRNWGIGEPFPDKECSAGYVCDFGTGLCICQSPPCDCITDDDCAWNEDCINGDCIINDEACQTHSECELYWERCEDNRCTRSCTPINRQCGDGSSSCGCTCCYGLSCQYDGFPNYEYQCKVA